MAEAEHDQRSCKLNVYIDRHDGVKSTYDARQGLKQRFVVSGYIEDFDDTPSVFDGKRVRVEVQSPPNPAWLEKIATDLRANNACGVVLVRAGLKLVDFEAEEDVWETNFEADGGASEEEEVPMEDETFPVNSAEPVWIMLAVTPDAFVSIYSATIDTRERRRIMGMSLTLTGGMLPHPKSRLIDVRLKDLDVSKNRGYALDSIEVFETSLTNRTGC